MLGIIFDLDGTLWDSTISITKAWNKVFELENLEFHINNDMIKSLLGKTNSEISNIVFKNFNKSKQKYLMKKCAEQEIITLNQFGGKLYPNLEDTLKILIKKYQLFIVSNCQSGYIEAFLDYHNLRFYFSDIECEGNTSFSKKKNIEDIIKRNKIKKAIYIGDTVGDLIASQDANIPFIYAKYGFGKIENIKYKISDIKDLPCLLKEMNF